MSFFMSVQRWGDKMSHTRVSTCFKQDYKLFLKQLTLATAMSLKSVCCSKFATACVPNLRSDRN